MVMDGTANPSARRVIGNVLAGKKAGAFPGKVFEADSKEFANLLASPQGQSVAWLLSQLKAQLGAKTVKICRIWDDQDQTSLVVELADYPSLNETKAHPGTIGENTDKALTRHADGEVPWDVWVTKGKALLELLQCGSGPPSKFESHGDLEKWGWQRMERRCSSFATGALRLPAMQAFDDSNPLDYRACPYRCCAGIVRTAETARYSLPRHPTLSRPALLIRRLESLRRWQWQQTDAIIDYVKH